MAISPVTVGQSIAASIINAIIAAVNGLSVQSHVEWTATSASVNSATTASIGSLTYDAATSNVSTTALATISTNTLTIVAAGIYDLNWVGSIPVAPTGAAWVQVSDGTNSFRVGYPGSGTVWGQPFVAGWSWAAGTVLTFQFSHVSAAARVLTSRLALTRIGSA